MKVHIELGDEFEEPSVTIRAREWSPELEELVSLLKQQKPQRLFGEKDEQTVVLDPLEVDYVVSERRKVFAVVGAERFEVRMKLYEVEDLLAGFQFVRFSKSVIGNLRQLRRFELSFNGNWCVYFRSGNKEYISRKYVGAVKEQLMVGGFTDDR